LAQYDINLREYWRILKKRKFVVILITIALGIFSTSFAIIRAPAPLYTSICSIKFERETTVEGLYAKTITWSSGDDIETQITVIKSYPVFQRVVQKLGIMKRKGKAAEDSGEHVARIAENLESKVEVERENLTNILHIKVTDRSPAFAQRLANTIALTYKELHAEEQMKRTTEALKYINEQLIAVREKLQQSEEEFNRFSQKNQLISLDLQSEVLLARGQEIQNEIRQLNEDKGELEGVLLRLSRFIENPSGSGHDFFSTKATAQYQGTNDALVSLVLKKDTLLHDFTPQHPEVVAISRKIIENARKMAILLQLQISGMEKKGIDLGKDLEEVEKKTQILMDKKLEFDRLKRRVDSYDDMTALLERKNQEALIRKAEKPEEVTIVRPALLPTEPINPPKTVATGAMGIIIGLVLGIVIGFVVETFDTSLGAIEDVEETLGTHVIGIVPQADIRDIREALREKVPKGIKESTEKQLPYLVSHFVPKSMIAESFRGLRTNIQFKEAEKKITTIAVASTSPEEGKTLVAINLAITMAQAGTKVLVVGSDLRKPAIDRVFGVEMSPGLTDVLMGNYPWRDTVKTVTDIIMGQMSTDEVMMTPGLDNLHLITSGPIPPNPAELIDSERLSLFIQEAKKEYDIIIFDSTPILSTADAAILGTKVDGVLLVYRVGSVSRGLLRRSTAQLQQVKCDIMGVVLNGMRADVSPDFQDYKYYSTYYAYGEERKRRKGGMHGRLLSFFRQKGEAEEKKEQKIAISEEPKGLKIKGPRRPRNRKLLLLLVAMGLLAGGALWQSGLISPSKPQGKKTSIKKDQVRPADKKTGPPKRAIESKSKGVSKQTTPGVSETRARPAIKTPMPQIPTVKKQATDVKEPVAKKEAPKAAMPEKPEGIGPKTSPTVPAKEPPAKSVTTVAKDQSETSLPEEPEIVTPAPKPTLSQKEPAYPYSLYLGSFRTRERTERAISIYSQKGLSPYCSKVDFDDKGTWFRVFTGHFQDRASAEKFKERHGLEEGTVKRTAYANLIGTYTAQGELANRIGSLKRMGYFPYFIEDQDGNSRLYIGAFITREGAEQQDYELKLDGVESQIVQR